MLRLEQIAARFGGEVIGDGAVEIHRVAPLGSAVAGDISFLSNPRYVSQLDQSMASAVIVPPRFRDHLEGRNGIVDDDPYLYFARTSQLLNPRRRPIPGMHSTAAVACDVPASVSIGPGASVGEGATIGENVVIGPGCHIGSGCRIGEGAFFHANVTVYDGCEIGRDCILHSGVVIGSDGFGFAREKQGSWVKIPQTGRVLIGDDVEIGANTVIDRGAIEDTVIGKGVKLDNLIHIAHNVRIGDYTAIAGCVGIAGSTTIGARCMIGGQVGIIGHAEICDDTVISAGTTVIKSIRQPGVYTGSLPMLKHADWVRNFAHLRHLDALSKRVRELEKLIEQRDRD